MKILRMSSLIPIIFWVSQSYADVLTSFDLKSRLGKQQQQNGKYREAHRIFQEGYREARVGRDVEWMSKFLFYQGNTYLLEAEQNKSIANTQALAQRAAKVYQQVVRQRPESGSAKVNLARALALSGEDIKADTWYQKAIALNDKKQVLFRIQYADYLAQRSPKKAVRQLRIVLKDQPDNLTAHKRLLKFYSTPGYARSLKKYLIEQVNAGQALRAQDAVLQAMLKPELSDKDKLDLMPVLALSLSKQHSSANDYVKSAATDKLTQVWKLRPALRRCIKELNDTMISRRVIDYVWWSANPERKKAISQLLRARARYYDQNKQPKLASGLYNEAAKLVGDKDPTAVRELVDFYSKRGDLEGINKVSKDFRYPLFRGKVQAYQKGDIDEIYNYHRTLASIYSFQAKKTGDWGSMRKSDSATFQLQRAYSTANRSKKIVPDTRLVNNLATSYEAKGNTEQANDVRINAAEMYTAKGNTVAADRVLQTVKVDRLNNVALQRYNTIKVNPQIADPNKKKIVPAVILPNKVQPKLITPKENLNVENPNTQKFSGGTNLNGGSLKNSTDVRRLNNAELEPSKQKIQLQKPATLDNTKLIKNQTQQFKIQLPEKDD